MTDRNSPQKERWQQIDDAFQAAVELSGATLEVHLVEIGASDADLAAEVRSLLAVDTGIVGNMVARAADDLVRDALEGDEDTWVKSLRFGPYRAVRRLGHGGMGTVYLGERTDDDFQQQVALKVVRQSRVSESTRLRFRDERRILAGLRHQGIARLIDGGVADDGFTLWLAMEYVDGQTLLEALAKAPLRQRLQGFLDICDAVQYAHANLVVHQDLKPSNILVDAEGRAKLLDFGIATVLSANTESSEDGDAKDGTRALTPAYAAPEQLDGSPITTATDLYTLGVLLYELLTGRHPFEAQRRTGQLDTAILNTLPTPPSRAHQEDPEGYRGLEDLPRDLDFLCLKALSKTPRDRYGTAAELAEDIRRLLGDRPVLAAAQTPGYLLGKWIRRHRSQALISAVAASAILILTLVYGLRLAEERDLAQAESRKATEVANFLTELFSASDPSDVDSTGLTARELLDRGAQRIDGDLADEPVLRADLLHVLGDVHKRLGLYDRSLELLERAVEINRGLGDDRAEERALALQRVGEVHLFEERFDAADEALRQALDAQRNLSAAPSAEVAETLDLLGRMERLRRRHGDAEPLHQEALDIRRQLFGDDSLPVSESLQSLASLRHSQRRPDDAIELIRQALEIRRRHLGAQHPETVELQQNLGSSLQRVGQPEASLTILEEALEGARTHYGEAHQNVGWTLSSMAYSLQQLGRLDEAVDHDRQAVGIFRARGGSPAGVSALVQLSRHLTQLGQLADAEAAAREALVWLGDSPEEPDPKRSNVLVDLGTILTLDGRYDAADDVLRETLRLDIATFGDDHPYVAQDRYKLGELARQAGRPNDALEWLDLAIERQQRLRPGANALGLSLTSRGETLILLHRAEDAQAACQEALDVFAVETPEDHPDVASARFCLGTALVVGGQVTEGRKEMEAAVEKLRSKLGQGSSRVEDAEARLDALGSTPSD